MSFDLNEHFGSCNLPPDSSTDKSPEIPCFSGTAFPMVLTTISCATFRSVDTRVFGGCVRFCVFGVCACFSDMCHLQQMCLKPCINLCLFGLCVEHVWSVCAIFLQLFYRQKPGDLFFRPPHATNLRAFFCRRVFFFFFKFFYCLGLGLGYGVKRGLSTWTNMSFKKKKIKHTPNTLQTHKNAQTLQTHSTHTPNTQKCTHTPNTQTRTHSKHTKTHTPPKSQVSPERKVAQGSWLVPLERPYPNYGGTPRGSGTAFPMVSTTTLCDLPFRRYATFWRLCAFLCVWSVCVFVCLECVCIFVCLECVWSVFGVSVHFCVFGVCLECV